MRRRFVSGELPWEEFSSDEPSRRAAFVYGIDGQDEQRGEVHIPVARSVAADFQLG
jgi:hypothetical protein